MATKAEQERADEQRRGRGRKTRAGRTKPGIKVKDRSRSKKHAERKATYALEETAGGRPARKSTRKSANRSKPDAGLNGREEIKKGSPEQRYRKAQARSKGKTV
jgi:hypothetical protein